MGILTVVYFIPIAGMILEVYTKTKPCSIKETNKLKAEKCVDGKPSVMSLIGVLSTGIFMKPDLIYKPELKNGVL
jgi:hypothetical protein